MSMSNFTEMKSEVIFCRKMINQDFWCNYQKIGATTFVSVIMGNIKMEKIHSFVFKAPSSSTSFFLNIADAT